MKWYKFPGIQNLDQPFIKSNKAGKKNICLVMYEGELFALSARCPHAGGDLSIGWSNNSKLICPFHRYSYDLHTGKGSEGQHDYIDTYPVEIREHAVYTGIRSFLEKIKEEFKK